MNDRAVVDHEIGVFLDYLLNEAVEITFDQRAVFHQLKALGVKRLVTGEGGIDRIGVHGRDRQALAAEVLDEQGRDKGLADAALALQREMNLTGEGVQGRSGYVVHRCGAPFR